MANRREKPHNLANAEARARDPHTSASRLDGTADELEAIAREQYAEACRGYFPGFAFSDLPSNFVVPLELHDEGRANATQRGDDPSTWTGRIVRSVWDLSRDVSRWGRIPERMLDYPAPHAVPKVPDGWNYAATIGDAKPHRFDLKNPRLYALDGRQVPWIETDLTSLTLQYTGPKGHFATMLLEAFTQAPTNDQGAEVVAYLEHHRTRGGNPEALTDYVVDLLECWKVEPLQRLNKRTWKEEPVPRQRIMIRAMEGWLADARKAPALVKGGTSAKDRPEPPTLVDKLGEVEGATKRFMGLVRGAGLCDASGRWIAANDAKGKSKLIAAWDAVVEVLKVPDFDTQKALVKALKDHFKGLKGLEALHKVRKRHLYTDRLKDYTTELFGN